MPVIADANKQLAADEIDAKIVILKDWANTKIPCCTTDDGSLFRNNNGDTILEFFPTNIASFCRWDGSQNSGITRAFCSKIELTTRSTLYRTHSDKIIEIERLFTELSALAKRQRREVNRTELIGDLEREVLYLRELVSKQGDEITAAAINSTEMEAELLRRERALTNLRTHYDVENQQLKARNAELTATIQKLSPLRKED